MHESLLVAFFECVLFAGTRTSMSMSMSTSTSVCVIEFHLANRRPSDIDFIQSNACWQDKQLGLRHDEAGI